MAGDPTARDSTQPSLNRLKYLNASLISVKAWLETFRSIPLIRYQGVSTMILHHFRHCIGMLLVLSTLDDPAWDKQDARRTVDFLGMVDFIMTNFGKVAEAIGMDTGPADEKGNDAFSQAARRGMMIRDIWAKNLAEGDAQPDSEPAVAATSSMPGLTAMGWTGYVGGVNDIDFGDFDWMDSVIYGGQQPSS